MAKSYVSGKSPSMGKGSFANLPQEVKMTEFPKTDHYNSTDIDDTIEGIDEIERHGVGKVRKHISYQK